MTKRRRADPGLKPPRMYPTAHRVAAISFRTGAIDCTCGAAILEPDDPVGDRNAGLASAWAEHRRAAGAPVLSLSEAVGARRSSGKFSILSHAAQRARGTAP